MRQGKSDLSTINREASIGCASVREKTRVDANTIVQSREKVLVHGCVKFLPALA